MKKFLLLSFLALGAFSLPNIANATNVKATEDSGNHSFYGSYLVDSFYLSYADENPFMGDYPLVINEKNVVTQFADYDLSSFSGGMEIVGRISGNKFTFNSMMGILVVGENYQNGHYTILNGETTSDKFKVAPVVLTYNPKDNSYELTNWTLWDYDPEKNIYTQIGMCMTMGVKVGEAPEIVNYSGTYTAAGLHTVYVNGKKGESFEDTFLMTIQPDSEGNYEFTNFGGYEVGLTPKGWLGVFGPAYGNTIELQGVALNSSEENGINLSGPFDEYDKVYTVAITFEEDKQGTISDFGVWSMKNGKAVELISTWTNLSFVEGDNTAIESISSEENSTPAYYNLQGLKVSNPDKGLYIIKEGNKTRKVMIK